MSSSGLAMGLAPGIQPGMQAGIQFNHPVRDAAKGEPTAIRITQVVKPCLTEIVAPAARTLTEVEAAKPDVATKAALSKLHKAIDELYEKQGDSFEAQVKHSAITGLEKLNPTRLKLTTDGLEAAGATTKILQELAQGEYSVESSAEYAKAACSLLLNHLQGGARKPQSKVDELCKRVLEESDVVVKSRLHEECNNPSFRVNDRASNTTLSIIKQARNDYEASHKFVIENFPLYHTQTRELVGYESDVLLGFNRFPITCRVTCLNTQDGITQEKEGVMQAFVPNARALGSNGLYQENGGKFLRSIDKGQAHMSAISGVIKGIAAGHIDNYVVIEDTETGKASGIHEIDLKECMIPFNRMPALYKVKRTEGVTVHGEDLEKKLSELEEKAAQLEPEITALNKKAQTRTARKVNLNRQTELAQINTELATVKRLIATERKSIVMARMCALGLPQNNKPFEKAALLFLRHPSLPILMDAHHASIRRQNYEIQHSALSAQRARLDALRSFAEVELKKDVITSTPRDVYFQIFGGKELFDLAMTKNYSPIAAFNNIVGSAYRHEFKDLAHPEAMPGRPVGRPASDSEAARMVFENLQVLYSAESPNNKR